MEEKQKTVILEFPLGDTEQQKEYQELCCLDSLRRKEIPVNPHLFYDGLYSPNLKMSIVKNVEMRKTFETAHRRLRQLCDLAVVYYDLGITDAMSTAILFNEKNNIPIEYRSVMDDEQRLEALIALRSQK